MKKALTVMACAAMVAGCSKPAQTTYYAKATDAAKPVERKPRAIKSADGKCVKYPAGSHIDWSCSYDKEHGRLLGFGGMGASLRRRSSGSVQPQL